MASELDADRTHPAAAPQRLDHPTSGEYQQLSYSTGFACDVQTNAGHGPMSRIPVMLDMPYGNKLKFEGGHVR